MKISGLHLLVSYTCTYECDHCFVFSSPGADGVMKLGWARDIIKQASEIPGLNEIYLEGGEPMLYYPVSLAISKYAVEMGMDVTIVSNSYYATSVEDAEEWLRPFKEAGVKTFSLSEDDFHGGTDDDEIPPNKAFIAAENLGLNVDKICIEPPGSMYDDKRPGEPILGGGVRFKGRAVEKLADDSLPKQNWSVFIECPDEDFINVGRLHLDPYGNLYACQGLCVGNVNEKSLAEIIADYDPESHPVIGPLMRGGPAELIREYNLPVTGGFHDACHACYVARKHLRSRFPDVLAPSQVYGE